MVEGNVCGRENKCQVEVNLMHYEHAAHIIRIERDHLFMLWCCFMIMFNESILIMLRYRNYCNSTDQSGH